MLENDDYFKSSLEDKAYFLNEVATATRTGVYSINFNENLFFVDTIGRSILGFPEEEYLTITSASKLFFNEQDVKQILQACLKGEFFESEVKMISYHNETIWMKLTGKPLYDGTRNFIGLRGVFTNINKYVRDREEVEQHSRIIQAQNERLLHFAHIISHNLRSHSSNLALTLELFDDVSKDERSTLFYSYMNEISQNLNMTLDHLNEVVTYNSQNTTMALIDLSALVEKTICKYQKTLKSIDARLNLDFSEFAFIEYVPSFFDSIMKTLIANAIKHRSSDRRLKIDIYTKLKNDKKLLIIKDNGIGIDFKEGASEVFKMKRKDNNDNESSKRLNLFLVKNQVEALGGDMVVKSKKGKGTKFTIKF